MIKLSAQDQEATILYLLKHEIKKLKNTKLAEQRLMNIIYLIDCGQLLINKSRLLELCVKAKFGSNLVAPEQTENHKKPKENNEITKKKENTPKFRSITTSDLRNDVR